MESACFNQFFTIDKFYFSKSLSIALDKKNNLKFVAAAIYIFF